MDAHATATFGSASTVKKSLTDFDKQKNLATWQVAFTKKGLDLPGGTTLVDTLSSGQKLTDENGQEITDLNQLSEFLTKQLTGKNAGKRVTVTKNANGTYNLTFPDGIADSFTLNYYSSVPQNVTSYSNGIKWNGKGNTVNEGFEKPGSGVVKSFIKDEETGLPVNNQDGKVTWQVVINKENLQLDSWYIIDTLTNSTIDGPKNLTITEVPKGKTDSEGVTVPAGDYALSNVKKNSFRIDYKKATNSKFILTYESDYTVGTDPNKTVSNKANYHYVVNGKDWSNDGNSSFKPFVDKRKQIGGNKGGNYNPVTGEVTWTIAINTSKLAFGANAVLTDPIPAGQTYVEGSAKAYLANDESKTLTFQYVKPNESLSLPPVTNLPVSDTKDPSVTAEKNPNGTLVVTGFPEGSKDTYKIVFRTKVGNGDSLAEGTAKNTASYADSSNQPFDVSGSVSFTNKDQYINKSHSSLGSDKSPKTIHYTVDVNKEKLPLRNVKVVDNNWVNLKVDPTTIKVTDSKGNVLTKDDYELVTEEQQFTVIFKIQNKDAQGKLVYEINDSYKVEYDADVLYNGNPGDPIKLSNDVQITGDNIQEGHKDDNDNLTVNVPAAGGSAQGEVRQLAITKVDDETNAALAGANVTLYRGKPADNQKVVTKDTDKNGVVTFDNLTYDTYYLVENTAPAGYYISPELKAGVPFEINGDTDKVNGKLGTVTNQKVGGIKLTKTDSATGAKLEGATFELFQDGKQVTKDALGNDLGELKTDKDGVLTIKNLIPGDYVVKEVGAPTGYHVTATDNAETVKPGATTEVTVKNDINKGQISFQKSSEGKLLKDAEFTLYDENGKAVDVQTSDANGVVTFDLEANHTYSVKETKNPAGYSGSYDLNEIKVTADGVVAYGAKGTKVGNNPIAVSNDLIKTQLKVTKEWALNENDPDFVQPKSVEVTLKRQDHTGLKTVVGSADLTADNQWSFTFKDLEKYDLTSPLNDKGEHAEYGYSVEESAVPGFKADISKAAESDDNSGLTVALTNTLVPTEVDGTKKWDQKAIDAGLVPDSLQVKLQYSLDGTSWNDYPDGTQKITKADGWNYHYEKLPTYTYQNGTAQKLQYRVTEVAVPKGFVQDFAKGSYDITNTLDLHKIKVVKTWDDQSDAFGVRPDDLQVTLMVKKGNDWVTYESVFHAKKELTLTADNKWQGEFADLPQYDANQNEIQYAVQENLGDNAKTYVPNGKVEDTQTAEVGATLDGTANLVNHLNTVNLSIDKKWSDFDDTYQTRPDLITFQLLAQSGDGAAAPVTRDHPNGEYQIKGPDFKTLSIKDLPKYDKKGNLITYSVKETNIAQNYQETPKYEGTDNSLSITNILETTKVTISKKWDEVGNLAYARPEVRLQLFRQAGEEGEKEAMTDKEGTKNFIKVIAAGSTADWSYTFENLPAKAKDGTPYSYSVKEISENNNYHVSYPDSLTVLNTLNVKRIVIDKHWEDQHNLFDSRPDMVEFELYVTDSTGERPFVVGEDHHQLIQTVNVKEGDDWTRTFDNLPAQDVDGSELIYSVKEVVKDADGNVLTPNYTSENDGDRMINKLVTTEISGTKTWNDQDNQFNSRPESIKVQLLQNGKALKGEQFVKTVTADDNWQYTFSDLPKVDRAGVDYQYTVEEISTPANYETTIDGMNLTNKLLTTSVKGEKTWSDQENKYQTRPESIKVQLLQNGQALTDKEFTKTVTAKDNWHYQFTDLPKVDPTGKEYLYTVQEVSAPANYQVKASGMDLENSLVTTQLSGKKIWVDNHDQDNLRPDAIKVALLQNGKQLAVTTVTEADNWKYSFTDLPKLDQKGQAYVYTVKELNVPKGYTATVDGHNLVNTHKPNVPNKPKIPKTPNDKTKKPRRMFPRTNDTVQPIVTVLGLVIILAVGVIVVYRRKKQL